MLEKQESKKWYGREWIFPILFLVFALVLEMVNFVTLNLGIMPIYFVFDLAVIVFLCGVLSFFKTGGGWWIGFASFFLLIQVVLNITNATFYSVFGDVFSISMMGLGEEGKNAFEFEFLNIPSIFVNLFVWITFIVLCVFLSKKTIFKASLPRKSKIALLLTTILGFQIIGAGMFDFGVNTIKLNAEAQKTASASTTIDDEDMWDNMYIKSVSLQKFGTYGYYLKNTCDLLFGGGKMSEEDQQKVASFVSEGENYLASSQYSGIAKGDNLIILMLESFDRFAIDPIYTPFLYQMATGQYDGAQYMSSFYAKNKTNVSEDISLSSHIANGKLYSSYYHTVGLDMPYSLPNLFKHDGDGSTEIEANYFHGYLKTFYDRVNVNSALGFDNVYALEDCTLEQKSTKWNDWILDSEYIDNMIDLFVPTDKRFFSFYTTISTHGSYEFDNPRIYDNLQYVDDHFDEYVDYVKNKTDLVIPTDKGVLKEYKQFKAFTMDTDKMVQNLFENLQQKGLLDNTTVVMFADHNAYYDDLCYKIKGIVKDEYSNIEANHLPCIIYNDELPAAVNDTYCSTYDIFPTICDLFNLSYNKSLTQGYSIFSDDIANTVFVSSQRGMYIKGIFTANLHDFVVLDDTLTQDDVNKFRDNLLNFYDKQEKIERIYQYNYFGNYA